ncbi:MAG: hypothetical protein KJ069_31810 [Anaerolineae bacterium]|nr:hypothetical protein [Anaerolineae bacterium]
MKVTKLFPGNTKMVIGGYLLTLFVSLLISGCTPKEAQLIQGEYVEPTKLATRVPTVTEILTNPTNTITPISIQTSESTMTLTPSPVSTSTPSQTPTTIPVATLTFAERQVLFREFMATNEDCDLPCWWGVELGESLENVNQRFSDLGMPWLVIEESNFVDSDRMGVLNAGYIDEDETRASYRLRVYTEFHELRNAVDYIYIKIDRPSSMEGQQEFIRDWEQYYLSSFLQRYGKPTQVYFRLRSIADPMDPPQFSVSLLYREKGLAITYHIIGRWLQHQDAQAEFCLDIENVQAIELSLFNPEGFDRWGYQFAPYHDELYEPLTWEAEFGMPLDTFYETYRQPENLNCLVLSPG